VAGAAAVEDLASPRQPTPRSACIAGLDQDPAVAIARDPDADLLVRIAAGDGDEAMGALYDRFAGRVYGLGVRQLGSATAAEELVQETFVEVWRSAGRFDPQRGRADTFVFTIARRRAIDQIRRRSVRPAEGGTATERGTPDGVDRMLDGMVVRDCLVRLSPAHREVIELAHDHGLTQTEIAARLDIPVGTVKTRSHHALRALRLALHERGIDA
jgi:RNA polymerase sigma-70 factor (ECF subfamily)